MAVLPLLFKKKNYVGCCGAKIFSFNMFGFQLTVEDRGKVFFQFALK